MGGCPQESALQPPCYRNWPRTPGTSSNRIDKKQKCPVIACLQVPPPTEKDKLANRQGQSQADLDALLVHEIQCCVEIPKPRWLRLKKPRADATLVVLRPRPVTERPCDDRLRFKRGYTLSLDERKRSGGGARPPVRLNQQIVGPLKQHLLAPEELVGNDYALARRPSAGDGLKVEPGPQPPEKLRDVRPAGGDSGTLIMSSDRSRSSSTSV